MKPKAALFLLLTAAIGLLCQPAVALTCVSPNPQATDPNLGCITSLVSPAICDGNKKTIGVCEEVTVDGCKSIADIDMDGIPPLASIRARLTIGEPTPGSPERGTIVLMLGGGGGGLWEFASQLTSHPVVTSVASQDVVSILHDLGYRTVQIQWLLSNWFEIPLSGSGDINQEGLLRAACRPATLFRYIYERFHKTGTAFCGAGNSAGAAQFAYAMTDYDQGDGSLRLFDAVVFSSGPPFITLAQGCDQTPVDELALASDPAYLAFPGGKSLVDTAFGDAGVSLGGPCTQGPGTPGMPSTYYMPSAATTCDPSPCDGTTPSTWTVLMDDNSNAHAGAVLSFPDVSITTITAGDQLDVSSQFPDCVDPFDPNERPCCPPLCSVSQVPGCCPDDGSVCCWTGDDAHGSAYSAENFFTTLSGQSGHGPLNSIEMTDQEHSMPARVGGAWAIRDTLLSECHVQ